MRRRTYGNKDIRGKYMYIVGSLNTLHYSSDYGKTFVSVRVDTGFMAWDAAISYSGQYQVMVGEGPVYSSSDYGKTWVKARTGTVDPVVSVAAISSDGKYMTASNMTGGTIYSSDYGKTWKQSYSIYGGSCVSMSSSGKYQLVNKDMRDSYRSDDYGESWLIAIKKEYNSGVASAISANGKYQTVALGAYYYEFYRSEDYGMNWKLVHVDSSTGNVIAMSDDGRKQMTPSSTRIITSYDYGITWQEPKTTPIKKKIESICTYGDCRIQLIASGSEVYKSKDYGTTWESVPSPTDRIRTIAINK